MRRRFIDTLADIARTDPRVMLLTGDMGYTVVEPFAAEFPDRFVNVGVAEQNMIGLATGLAEAGFIPFAYSIATFAVLRPFEFIRNGPVLQALPVRIVGIGGGFEYGPAGPTHHALEDVALLRSQPGMTVVCPADHEQAASALRRTWDLPGPVYYRLGRDERAVVPGLRGRFNLEEDECEIRRGRDLILISLGPAAHLAMAAADLLSADGIDAGVAVVAAIHPPPTRQLMAMLQRYPAAMTIEAHGATGGLGTVVAEVIADHGLRCGLRRCAVGTLTHETGSDQWLLSRHGMSPEAVCRRARTLADASKP